MNNLQVSSQKINLMVGSHTTHQMLELIARMACLGPVRVIDGCNCCDGFQLAHRISQMTIELYPAMERVFTVWPDNCYKMHTMVTQAPQDGIPLLIPGMLATLYDEDVSLKETQRLLQSCLEALRSVCVTQPVIISASPPIQRIAERKILLEMLMEAADRTIFVQEAQNAKKTATQLSLFS
jgi:hypothetical protein